MATERLSMRKTKEILRLKWVMKRSHREVANSLGVSVGVVSKTLARARALELTWATAEGLEESALEAKLYGVPRVPTGNRPKPDPVSIHLERMKTGVTLELLHLEYLEEHPNGYGYTVFCDVYREWRKRKKLTMRQNHNAGEKLFVDYSGKKPALMNRETGEVESVELFVAVLGASNYTFVEASRSQKSRDFLMSHVRALDFLGGCPKAFVPDQLKSGVVAACRYEPTTQRTYTELARHYGVAILPARPGKPRDKAKVEAGVLVVQRWVLSKLRNQTFYSLEALNERIGELCDELNSKPMRQYGGKSRRDLFEEIDRPALSRLPPERFIYADWRHAKTNIDYHIEFDKHFYSVPYALVREPVEVRATALTIEVFHKGKRVASHLRSYQAGRHTTEASPMPKSHQKHLEWTPTRMIT